MMASISRSVGWMLAATVIFAACNLAAANPLLAPTVDYVADFGITRGSDHSFATPARYIYGGRKLCAELVGILTLVDLDRCKTVAMIPRVRTYWRPLSFAYAGGDAPLDRRRRKQPFGSAGKRCWGGLSPSIMSAARDAGVPSAG